MRTKSKLALVKLYTIFIVLLLPIDWFAPTGALFREFGAKPAAILLTIGGLLGIFVVRRQRLTMAKIETQVTKIFLIWIALGAFAFFVNIVFGWSSWDYFRNPLTQFGAQAMLVVACGVAIIGNARLMNVFPIISQVMLVLPWAAAFHLTVFMAEAAGILVDDSGILLLFRNDDGLIERPTGLTSEPSYFGTMAALYGMALLYIPAHGAKRVINITLAILLYVCALYISAKTMALVAGAQAIYLILRQSRNKNGRIMAIILFVVTLWSGYYFVQNFATLDVSENLSSAMRFGSSLLAMNVVAEGYGFSGIGFGQFHFFYRDEFAPGYLFFSEEGLNQLSRDAASRASTFNFYVRVLLEIGICGFLILLVLVHKLWRVEVTPSTLYVSLLFVGSLGFLMTQDTYFYPPLVFSAAAIISGFGGKLKK